MKSGIFFRLAKASARSRLGRAVLRIVATAPGGHIVLLSALKRANPLLRRQWAEKIMRFLRPEQRSHVAARFRRLADSRAEIEVTEIYWLVAGHAASVWTVSQEILNPQPHGLAEVVCSNTNLLFAQAIAAYEIPHYKSATVAFTAIRKLAPRELTVGFEYLKAAYAAGQIRRKDLATEFFARQFYLSVGEYGREEDVQFHGWLFHNVLAEVPSHIQRELYQGKGRRIGIFFLSSTQALGHAILDPYYFLALVGRRYDTLIFIGPSRSSYWSASRCCLEVIEQYGHYVETARDLLLNLSWMSLGTSTHESTNLTLPLTRGDSAELGQSYLPESQQLGTVDIVVENYWSLLREAAHRTRDRNDEFRHNAWHMSIPERFVRVGELFCQRSGIDLGRPIVVLHARAQNYHSIEKQSFRNADIDHYALGVRGLLDAGFQVVRIGDAGMAPLRIEHSDYFELPFMDGYDHLLDPFLISRARFMIGCQSGPCAYARALGIPLLSVNAVLHYTLLPSRMEMACFKRYLRRNGTRWDDISLEEALAAGVYHFDNSIQFERANIRLQQAGPDEILSAIKDMIAWLDRPDLSETSLQLRFRSAVEAVADELMHRGSDLDLPIGDFLGIALPGYRISPTVAVLRERGATVRARDAAADGK